MNDHQQVPPHESDDEITQQIRGRVEAIWGTVPSLQGVNFEIEQLLGEDRRKKVEEINEILTQVAIHLKEYNTTRFPKASSDMEDDKQGESKP